MFNKSPSICCTLFAIDDVIVTSVNTYTSMMRITLKISTRSNLCQKIKKYGAKATAWMFSNKNWSLGGLKALMNKLTTRVLLFDLLGSGWPCIVHTVPVLSIFCRSALSVHQDSSFCSETAWAITLLHISYFLVKIWSSTYLQC